MQGCSDHSSVDKLAAELMPSDVASQTSNPFTKRLTMKVSFMTLHIAGFFIVWVSFARIL